MAKTWRFKIRASVGGTSKGHFFTNTVHVNTAAALASPEMAALAAGIAASFRRGFLSIVTIQSVTISDPARGGQGYDPAQVRTVAIGLAGQKLLDANQPEIKEVVAKIRTTGATGRPGTLSIRMATFDNEVTGSGDGEPNSAAPIAGIDGVVQSLNDAMTAGADYRIWSRNKAGVISDRSVTSFQYAGVGHRDAHTRRKSKKASTKAPAWTRRALDVAKQVVDLAGAYQIAKVGTAALEAAPVAAAIEAAGAAAGELLPLLALL